jgi:VWFA-related protein
MGRNLSLVREAAARLVDSLRPGDRAALVEVKDSVAVPQPLTGDPGRIVAAVDALQPSGQTAVYDGLYLSLREFERQRRVRAEMRRQALVLLSDGRDNASHVTFEDVTELARRMDVTVYTIAPAEASDGWALRTLARETGGVAFFPSKRFELEAIYGTIARELVSQYALGYAAPAGENDAVFRHVTVRVLPPARGIARTRSGYFARRPAPVTISSR